MDYRNELGNWEEIILEPSGDTLPVGAITQFGGETAPTNWLFCNGQAVSRTDFAELFSAIGTTYGDGDGSTTFNVPDFGSRSPMGVGTGTDGTNSETTTLGQEKGEYKHQLTVAELASHSHTFKAGLSFTGNGNVETGLNASRFDLRDDKHILSTGGDQAHNTIHPVLGVNFIIKAKQSIGIVGTVSEDITDTNNNAVPTCETVKDYVDEKSNYILNGTVLYESTSGTTGTVTLSESVANYDYIDIHFKTNDGNFIKTERLYKPNGKATSLMYWHLSDNTFGYVKVRSININGTSITNSHYSEFSISTSVSASASNNIYITRVVGYK